MCMGPSQSLGVSNVARPYLARRCFVGRPTQVFA